MPVLHPPHDFGDKEDLARGGCACQAERAPRSNVTDAPEVRDGAFA
ncbi:hypothetical protein HUA78_38580 [Myxococcus sp. CA033]|nr:hypothetical protein [Myxococcus sp. CA033]NTX40352.1 hypothetical protein [Myxococcus sp. CA033]